jgi:thioredoxin
MKYLSIVILAFVIGSSSCQSQQSGGKTLEAPEFNQLLGQTKDAFVLDVRTEQEFAGGYIKDAVNINYNSEEFATRIAKLDKSKPYFVYCLAGGRSASAAKYMRSNGFKQVYDLKGGLLGWQANNLPLVSTKTSADTITFEAYQSLTTSNQIVLIDFYAPWCGPCKRLEPILEELKTTYKDKVKIIRINTDNNRDLSVKLGIDEIPNIKIYKKGKLVNNYIGYIAKEELEKIF